MDPIATLEELLRLANIILNGDDTEEPDGLRIDAARLAELVVALDEWIRGGGFLPAAWSARQASPALQQWIVTATLQPTNYNHPNSEVVEAATEKDARALVKDHLRDFGSYEKYTYVVKPYVAPPPGRVLDSLRVERVLGTRQTAKKSPPPASIPSVCDIAVDALLFERAGCDPTSGEVTGKVFLRREGDINPYFRAGAHAGSEHDYVTRAEAQRLAGVENLPLLEVGDE